MQRFVQIIELLTYVTVYSLSIDVLIDDLGNVTIFIPSNLI
jgi:hypothetical protein